MAKVNTKFIIGLTVGVLVLVGGAIVALNFVFKSAADLAKTGDGFNSKGEFAVAALYYSKAVNKEQTNVTYLEKWRDALTAYAAPDQTRAEDAFLKLRTALRQLGRIQRTNVEAQRAYLDVILESIQSSGGPNRESLTYLADETETFLAFYDGKPSGEWNKLERYRAVTWAQIVQESPDIKDSDIKKAEDYLKQAAAADPLDALTVLAQEGFYTILGRRAKQAEKLQEATANEAMASQILTSFLERAPEQPDALLRKIERDFDRTLAEMGGLKESAQQVELLNRKQQQWKQEMDLVLKGVKALAPGQVEPGVLAQLRRTEEILDYGAKQSRTLAAIDHALSGRSDDADLLVAKSTIYAALFEYGKALETIKRIDSLPAKGTSLAALRLFGYKINSVLFQAIWSIKQADSVDPSKDPEGRKALIEAGRGYLAKLRELQEAESPPVLLVEAYVSYIDGQYVQADSFVDRYISKTKSEDPDAYWLKHLVALRRQNPGDAKAALMKVVERDRRNLLAALKFAQIEIELRNFDSAIEALDRLLAAVPGNPAATALRNSAMAQAGRGSSSDPVLQVLLDADRMSVANAGNPDVDQQIIDFVKKALVVHAGDPRLVRGLAIAYIRSGDRAGATKVIEESLAKTPDDPVLKDLLAQLSSEDQVSWAIERVKQSTEMSELDKNLQIYQMLVSSGKSADASAYLEAAAKLSPEHPMVLEQQFIRAIESKDMDGARKLTEAAARLNADNVKGATFQARMLSSTGQHAEAVTILEQAISRGGAGPELNRLLGRVQVMAGKPQDAIAAFQRAVEARPNDTLCNIDLLNCYVRAGRNEDALKFAKAVERYSGDNPIFRELYTTLEAQVGDKLLAIQRRERQAKIDPKDRRNLLSLAGLYIDQKNWREALTAIESSRAIGDGLDVAATRAQWHWQQGQIPEAKGVFEQFVSSQTGPANLMSSLAYASFLIQNGETEAGLGVLTAARDKQDPKQLEVDRALVDVYMFKNMYVEGAAACKRIIDSGVEGVSTYRQRYAECLIRTQDFEGAFRELDSLSPSGSEDMVTLLLKAEAKGGMKDVAGERKLLDEAVVRFPTEAIVFQRRGQVLLNQPGFESDAKADFDAALRLQPNNWETMRLRATSMVALNDINGAIREFREAIRVNPQNNEMIYGLVSDLLRLKRFDDAALVAEENFARRKSDLPFALKLAELFSRADQHAQAISLGRAALDLDKDRTDPVVQPLLDSMLRASPPLLRDAEALLNQVGQARLEKNPGFLMAMAKIRILQGRMQDADRMAIAAVGLLDPKKPNQMILWFNDIRQVQPDSKKVVLFLDNIAGQGVTTEAKEWLEFLKSNILVNEVATTPQGLEILENLSKTATLPIVNQLAFRTAGSVQYNLGAYEEAAKAWEATLAKYPEDYESMNNLAYCYLKRLNKPQDALKHAALAAKGLPNSADVLDTLGLAQQASGDLDSAERTFRRAALLVENVQSDVTVCVHLASLLYDRNKLEEAREFLARAKAAQESNPDELKDEIKVELEALIKKVGS